MTASQSRSTALNPRNLTPPSKKEKIFAQFKRKDIVRLSSRPEKTYRGAPYLFISKNNKSAMGLFICFQKDELGNTKCVPLHPSKVTQKLVDKATDRNCSVRSTNLKLLKAEQKVFYLRNAHAVLAEKIKILEGREHELTEVQIPNIMRKIFFLQETKKNDPLKAYVGSILLIRKLRKLIDEQNKVRAKKHNEKANQKHNQNLLSRAIKEKSRLRSKSRHEMPR